METIYHIVVLTIDGNIKHYFVNKNIEAIYFTLSIKISDLVFSLY